MAGIIYIHVPKCGGSSFGAALRLRYLMSQTTIRLGHASQGLSRDDHIRSSYAQRLQDLHRYVAMGKRMIAGHVQYDPTLHSGAAAGYRFVTLLRDPVDRFVSHYRYLQRKHADPMRAATLEQFVDSTDAPRIASQYLFYFAGAWQQRGQDTDALTQTAIRNLARFDLVGRLEAPDDFARDLRRLTGTPLLRWQRNVAPPERPIAPDIRARIETLCAPDIAIYRSQCAHSAAA